ncbi:MAG: TetR/AcrR family transcriptional regulator [Acidimicrobiia bacterium]|nr:MAG: TetR/AcrR family transcriptional regulator [Acidimicrobiia bacterium]
MTIEEGQDRRVRRTKQRLQAALTSLIGEMSYDKITVQDLIDRADVGRSTFYAHYETKDDLLISGLDRLTVDMELHMADDPSAADAILPSLGLFRHAAENHERFRALIGSRGIDLVHKAAIDALTERARAAIDRRSAAGEHSSLPPDARAAFAAGSLMVLLTWWLDNDMPYPAETMADMYRQLTATA